MPTGSIIVNKAWGESGDVGTKAVLLKLRCISNGADTDFTDIYDHPEKYLPAGTNIYTDGTNKYIMLEKKDGAWPELTISNLLIQKSTERVPGGQDGSQPCKYRIEECGYINASGQAKFDLSGWTVTYSGGEDNGGHRVAEPKEVNPDTLTVTNTSTTGSIQVSKDFSGIENLPGTFTITATWTGHDPIELKPTGAAEVTTEDGLRIKRTDGEHTYTWTMDGLPIGTEIIFEETGYNMDGYNWYGTVTNQVTEEGTMKGKAVVSSEETLPDTAKVIFTNTYTAGVELPATGGSGTLIYTIAGLMLITLAGVLLAVRKRKANQD